MRRPGRGDRDKKQGLPHDPNQDGPIDIMPSAHGDSFTSSVHVHAAGWQLATVGAWCARLGDLD